MIKAMPMAPKTSDENIWFLNERIRFNLHCRLNECGIKLKIRIMNNSCEYTTSETLVCQRKMSVVDSSQKIGRIMYLHDTVMHSFSIGKCIEKRKKLQKSHRFQKTTFSPFCFLTYPNNLSRDMTKPTKWLCAQRRLRSAWASASQNDHYHSKKKKNIYIYIYIVQILISTSVAMVTSGINFDRICPKFTNGFIEFSSFLR